MTSRPPIRFGKLNDPSHRMDDMSAVADPLEHGRG